MDEDISITLNNTKSTHTQVPGTIEANHSQSYASIVAGHYHSNISSPTASHTGTQSLRAAELELENKRLRSCLQDFENSQRSLSTSSKSSVKSKQEMELETEVHEVKTLFAQQMAKFNGLEQKFNLLLSRFAEQDNSQPQQQSMQ